MSEVNKLVSEAAQRQIDKLKVAVDSAAIAVEKLNQKAQDLEESLTKKNLGWAKSIGVMKQIKANSDELDVAYSKLVTANDQLIAAANKHNAMLAKQAEAKRVQTLLNEQLIITNKNVTESELRVTNALNAKQKARLKMQQTAMAGIEQNKRAVLSSKSVVSQLEAESVTIQKLKLENQALAAQRDKMDISTAKGREAVKALNNGIAENTRLIAANTTASAANITTAATLGKGMTTALGYLRTLAYMLPGIGIAGIFNLVIEGVTGMITGLTKATGVQRLFNDALVEGAKNAAIESWNLDRLYKKTQDLSKPMETRVEAVNKLQKLWPDYFKALKDEDILNGNAKETYDALAKSIRATAKAKAFESAITKAYGDDIDEEIKLMKELDKASKDYALSKTGQKKLIAGGYGVGSTVKMTQEESQEYFRVQRNNAQMELDIFRKKQADRLKILYDALEKEEKAIDDRVKPEAAKRLPRGQEDIIDRSQNPYIDLQRARFMANYELMKADAERQADINKKVADNERETLFDRIDGLSAYYANRENILDLEETKELKEIDLQNEAILAKMQNLKTKMAKSTTTAYNREVMQKEFDAEQQLMIINEDNKKIIVAKYEYERTGLKKQAKEANLKLIADFDEKELRQAEIRYRKAMELNRKANAEYIELIQADMEAFAKMQDDESVRESTDLEIYLFERKMRHLNTYVEFEKTAATILMGLADAIYAHENKLIDERERKMNESYDIDKKRIESSFTNKVEKEQELMKLDARKEALQKQIDRDRRLAARKQARDQKMADMANIIGSTYVAVMAALGAKPWTLANIAIAAGIGAQGAANFARVAATPLPAYKDGIGIGNGEHPGGWAIVGDGGKRELVQEPGKKPWITPATPTLVNLPKHVKVFPDVDSIAPIYGLPNTEYKKQNSNEALYAVGDKLDTLIDETKKSKSITNIEIIDLSSHNLHVLKNRR